ncbi:MAG: hypothetical protein U0V87_18420 [Acidobacteriota bacterium]
MIAKTCVRLIAFSMVVAVGAGSIWAAIDPCAASCGSDWQATKQSQLRTLEAKLADLDQLTTSCLETSGDDGLVAAACVRDTNRQRTTARADYRKAINDATTKARECYLGCTAAARSQVDPATVTP